MFRVFHDARIMVSENSDKEGTEEIQRPRQRLVNFNLMSSTNRLWSHQIQCNYQLNNLIVRVSG